MFLLLLKELVIIFYWTLARPYLQCLQCNDRAMIRQICNDDVATVRSKKLTAQLEIDYIVVNLREKRLSITGLYTLNNSVAQLRQFATCR